MFVYVVVDWQCVVVEVLVVDYVEGQDVCYVFVGFFVVDGFDLDVWIKVWLLCLLVCGWCGIGVVGGDGDVGQVLIFVYQLVQVGGVDGDVGVWVVQVGCIVVVGQVD